jgi:aminoglycoside phosphotransferase
MHGNLQANMVLQALATLTLPRSAEHLLLEYQDAAGNLVPGQWYRSTDAAERELRDLSADDTARFALAHGGTVVLHLRGADRRLIGLAPLLRQPAARLLVHQPGRRAVVRLVEGDGVVFAKVVRPERAFALARAGDVVQRLAGGAFAAPRLLDVDAQAGVVRWSALSGVALHEVADEARAERGAWHAGQALRALHEMTPTALLSRHDPADERASLTRWLTLTAAYAPEVAAAIAPEVATLGEALGDRGRALTTIHRDCYDKQITVDTDGTVGLLDFDTLAYGESALDLANALVHVELRALQGLLTAERAERVQAALLAGYAPDAPVQARLPTYADATRLRLACVYSFRPNWQACVPALLAQVRCMHRRQH